MKGVAITPADRAGNARKCLQLNAAGDTGAASLKKNKGAVETHEHGTALL